MRSLPKPITLPPVVDVVLIQASVEKTLGSREEMSEPITVPGAPKPMPVPPWPVTVLGAA